jgi:hypothetical protein
VGGLNPPNSALGLFGCFHEQGEMSRVQREKGVSYSFSDTMMGLITQLQQYQSFLKIRLFARFLYQHSIADVLVLKLGQSQNITLFMTLKKKTTPSILSPHETDLLGLPSGKECD